MVIADLPTPPSPIITLIKIKTRIIYNFIHQKASNSKRNKSSGLWNDGEKKIIDYIPLYTIHLLRLFLIWHLPLVRTQIIELPFCGRGINTNRLMQRSSTPSRKSLRRCEEKRGPASWLRKRTHAERAPQTRSPEVGFFFATEIRQTCRVSD